MPEPRALPLSRPRNAPPRHRHSLGRSLCHRAAGAAAAVTVAALAATLLWPPRAVLVWNGSASSPVGLYRVTPPGGARAGDMAIAWPPDPARRLAAERGYLPANVPLVKQVAAVRGDRVCAAGEAVFVNGRFIARRRTEDARGRSLPWWTGCHRLEDGELFLLVPGLPDAFDGRYFGVTERRHLIGHARLIWPL